MHSIKMTQSQPAASSPASSSASSTPLYRVFRGLKSSQVISIPPTNAAWRATLNYLKTTYLEGRWKECETRCLRLVGTCRDSPFIHAYLLYLIGCCVEMHARNLHHHSMAKTKKIEDAILWFQRCEVILVNGMGSTGEDDAENVVSTPQVAASENQESEFFGPDASPLVQKKDRVKRLTKMIDRLVDGEDGPETSFDDDIDPFTSDHTPLQRPNPFKYSTSDVQPPFTPPPLRVRKGTPSQVDTPLSQLSPTSFISGKSFCRDESMASTPAQRDGGRFRTLASIMENMSDCVGTPEAWDESTIIIRDRDVAYPSSPSSSRDNEEHCTSGPIYEARIEAKKEAMRALVEKRVAAKMSGEWNDSTIVRDQDSVYQSSSTSLTDDQEYCTSGPIYEARIEAKKEAWRAIIEKRVAEKMAKVNQPVLVNSSTSTSLADSIHGDTKGRKIPRSVSDLIRDCLGKEGAEKMSPSCLRPIPHSSSAKPLPLCLKPKQTIGVADTDKASLARLQRAWERESFDGWFMKDSDCHSLYLVEQTWDSLRESYNLDMAENQSDVEARIARFDDQLGSLLRSVRQNISDLHQVAIDINHNRALHNQNQKMPQSKSYWSFSPISNEAMNESSLHHSRNTQDVKYNLGWSAPGAIPNESMAARIERLRRDGFNTVGLRNKERGHKGHEYYSNLCDEALKEIGILE